MVQSLNFLGESEEKYEKLQSGLLVFGQCFEAGTPEYEVEVLCSLLWRSALWQLHLHL
jgi:hypothetical protein